MALIDVTIENPSLVSTGGEGSPIPSSGTESEDGDSDPEAEFEEPASDATAEGTDDDLAETLKTISTLLTAATTIAGVLKKLRSEDKAEGEAGSAVEVAEGLFEDDEVDGEDEVDSFEEELVEDEEDETEADADEESEETDEDESGRGPGLKVAFVLVVLLIALVLWTRGDDEEESEFDDDWE